MLQLIAVQWCEFATYAEEASSIAIQNRLQVLAHCAEQVASQFDGELVTHPVKDRGERKILAFASVSHAYRAAQSLVQVLGAKNFSVRVGLHCGECSKRSSTWLGAPLHEIRELVEKEETPPFLSTEAFRLTLSSSDTPEEWKRLDRPLVLAGTAWTVYQVELSTLE